MPRDRRRHAPRTEVLWALAAFALGQLGLAVIVVFLLPAWRDPAYAHGAARLLRRTARAGERPTTVLVLGSSRVQDGLQARQLEADLKARLGKPIVVFNFGIAGAGPVTQAVVLKRLWDDGVRPDLVYVEVVPTLLAGPSAELRESLTPDRLRRDELRALGRYGLPSGRFRADWWAGLLAPCYAHRQAILRNLQGYWARHIDDCGWHDDSGAVVPASEAERWQALEVARKEHAAILKDFHLGGPGCAALRDLLGFCRQHGLRAALLRMPEGTEFRGWYSPRARTQIERFLTELATTYAAPLVDAREWVHDDGFRDSHHLIPSGAAIFTRRFARDAVLPMLARPTSLALDANLRLGRGRPRR